MLVCYWRACEYRSLARRTEDGTRTLPVGGWRGYHRRTLPLMAIMRAMAKVFRSADMCVSCDVSICPLFRRSHLGCGHLPVGDGQPGSPLVEFARRRTGAFSISQRRLRRFEPPLGKRLRTLLRSDLVFRVEEMARVGAETRGSRRS